MRARTVLVVALLGITQTHPGRLSAQMRPVYDRGAAGLTQVLLRLQTTASVLHTGAHPDDEDSAFLASAARGEHARVAYLSLNRGEGGQNILGPELFDALGVIRTEELLQARQLDGAEQFFTRAFDFGFSKTREEAAAKWNEQLVLGDMVRVIRTFRPLVVYSRFSGTPADGHGQHQLAGALTPLAFAAAADPAAFPEHLADGLLPWRARKLYRGSGFRPEPASPSTIDVPTGVVDPVIGRGYAEIAAEGRSQHKSQDMGTIEPRGPLASSLRLIESRVAVPERERSVFDGIDITVTGLAALAGLPEGSLASELRAIEAAATSALNRYRALEPEQSIPALADGLRATRRAQRTLNTLTATANARVDAEFLLAVKERDFVDALVRAAGVDVDPLADAETTTPGGTLEVDVRTFVARPATVALLSSIVQAPPGWHAESTPPTNRNDALVARREVPTQSRRYRLTAPADAMPTQPYFLARPRHGDVYAWTDADPRTEPFARPPLMGVVTMTIAGETLTVARPVTYRVADRIRGELRREVDVVPAVTVGIDSTLIVVPRARAGRPQQVVVRATSLSDRRITGRLRLRLPDGWSATPAQVPFTLEARGTRATATFAVSLPARGMTGRFEIGAEAEAGGVTYARDMQTIAYPHIQTHRVYAPATAVVSVLDLDVAPVRVGYIMGSGDQVPAAIRRLGLDVTMISDEMLGRGDLSRFDTIVVGIRASEARPEFTASHARLRQFMERGGALIVQYQQGDYAARGLPPYPVTASTNSRITDETAPVRLLAPRHRALRSPNRITAADFEGWVQERNLYAFTTIDARYTPLLESADPGEPAQRGGEVIANVGRGVYVYTAYAWFRQLPAGVPGAYRQFANLLSLGHTPARARIDPAPRRPR